MIVILKPGVRTEKREQLIGWLKNQGLGVHISEGSYQTVLGLIGDTAKVDKELVESLDIVDAVRVVSDPFKRCNRKFHPDDTVVEAGGVKIGGGSLALIAGPGSVESEEHIVALAKELKAAGADLLYGGAVKSRSAFDTRSTREEGIKYLLTAKKEVGIPVVAEIMGINDLEAYEEVDLLQIGAHNAQNFDLLREVGRLGKPVILRRGIANTLKEFLMSAECIMEAGNEKIILCERGIRTFNDYTKNTLDLSAVPLLHELSHLPVIADPSNATGSARLVPPMALASAACGADGISIEVHNDPMRAEADGARCIKTEDFAKLVSRVRKIHEVTA